MPRVGLDFAGERRPQGKFLCYYSITHPSSMRRPTRPGPLNPSALEYRVMDDSEIRGMARALQDLRKPWLRLDPPSGRVVIELLRDIKFYLEESRRQNRVTGQVLAEALSRLQGGDY